VKRIVALGLLALIQGCGEEKETGLAGYAEAEYIYLAPQEGGLLETLHVREGDLVSAGAPIFTLDPARLSLSVEQANAAAQGFEARANDEGALAKQVAEAEAAFALAERNLARSRDLVRDGAVSREKYDADAAERAAAKARLERARAERAAMLRDWDAMNAAVRLAERRLADLETTAPVEGVIERVYSRPGEVVAAGEPVVALLPPDNLKLRFYAPEGMLSSLALGAIVSFSCDGCAAGEARISFIASEPQFTPPIIYSIEEREKLVFLVEARPIALLRLRPGQPVTIEHSAPKIAARP
jgi:HlyD family secretion protein